MERAPASNRSRLASRMIWIGAAAWLAAVAGGFAFLLRYKSTPAAQSGAAPAQWPAGSRVPRSDRRSTLLLFAHPRCICTRASLAELARMMARFHDRVEAKVLFWMPADAPPDCPLRARAAGCQRALDVELRRRFGFREGRCSSERQAPGRVVLLFQGGITQSRGHEGDSFGQERIASLLTTGAADRADAPVFGCALGEEPPVRMARAGKRTTHEEGEQ